MATTVFDKFINVFLDFVTDLEDTFPEYEVPLQNVSFYITDRKKSHEDLIDSKWAVISQFKTLSESQRILLQNNDHNLFNSETPLELIMGIDFRTLGSNKVSEKNKDTIIMYLNILTLLADNLDPNKETVESESIMNNMLDMITNLNSTKKKDSAHLGAFIDSLNLGDSAAGDTFKEVMSDVGNHVDELMASGGNPLELLTGILKPSAEGNNFMDGIVKKMSSKIESGEINTQDLASVTNNVLESFNNISGGSNILNSLAKTLQEDGFSKNVQSDINKAISSMCIQAAGEPDTKSNPETNDEGFNELNTLCSDIPIPLSKFEESNQTKNINLNDIMDGLIKEMSSGGPQDVLTEFESTSDLNNIVQNMLKPIEKNNCTKPKRSRKGKCKRR